MSAAMPAVAGGVRSPAGLLRELVRRQPALAVFGLLLLAAVVLTSFGAVLDPEPFGGANKWFKPMRFQASLGVLMLTLAWCAGYLLPTRRVARLLRWAVPVAITASLYEAGYITWQAAHGEASHWNVGDPLHRVLWALMGVGAVPLTYIAFAFGRALHRDGDPRLPPAFRLSLVLGLALTFVLGASTGALLGVYGSHSVGHLPSEPGLPLFGWSTVGGDWRPAHFFGMHAGQVVPAFGACVAWLGIRRGTAAVGVFAGAYATLTLLCLLQAYRNHPFIAL